MTYIELLKAASSTLYVRVVDEGNDNDYVGATLRDWVLFYGGGMDLVDLDFITFTLEDGDAVSEVITIKDLDSSTDYYLELYDGEGELLYDGYGFETKSSSYVDLTPIDLKTTRYNDGFTFRFLACEDATSYEAKVVRNGVTTSNTSSYPTIRITGLDYCEQYTVYCRAKNSSKTGSWVFGYPCTVAPPRPIINSVDVVNKKISVAWSLAEATSKELNIYFELENYDTEDIEYSDCISTTDASGVYTFPAVDTGDYYVTMWVGYQATSTVELICLNGSNEYKAGKSVTVENERPTSWSWAGNDLSASNSKTALAYTAVTELLSTDNFSYKVWNDMVTKVGEFLEYKEYYSEKIGTNSFGFTTTSKCSTVLNKAQMTSSSRTLTATRFNALNCCICKMKSTGIGKVSKGDVVKGSYFTTLMTKLNAIT